jgi:hypothetical protein
MVIDKIYGPVERIGLVAPQQQQVPATTTGGLKRESFLHKKQGPFVMISALYCRGRGA